MKYWFYAFALLFFSCTSNENSQDTAEDTTLTNAASESAIIEKFEFVDSKNEQSGGNTNTMMLYVPVSAWDTEALKTLCREKKNSFTGFFLYVVVFDDKAHAAFPSDPFTAMYGMEEEKIKHIKAIYTFNTVNAYSTLQVYEINMWESPAKEIDI